MPVYLSVSTTAAYRRHRDWGVPQKTEHKGVRVV